jgi:hypothetical protein
MNTRNNGLKVKSSIKAAGMGPGNHNRKLSSGLKVKSSIKAAGMGPGNHNRSIVRLA